MRISAFLLLLLATGINAFSQSATGTITGLIVDPGRAVVPRASVDVKNVDTGQVYSTISTSSGFYTATALPPGLYAVSVSIKGFKEYTRGGLTLGAGQVMGIDVALEVGSVSESVTVDSRASLLKTETGDVTHNITLQDFQNLPLLGIGVANAGSSGVRNPFNAVLMIPGVSYSPNLNMIVDGAPNNTAAYRLDGLDNTNHTVPFALQENQPSAEAIQEVAVQTSNYAAEFGQAGGGLFNVTMKSGTNRYSGSVYEYFVNEALNAGVPYSNDGTGQRIRPLNRRSDFGVNLGGPIRILKVYDGHNRSFFFFNFEEYRETVGINMSATVPTAAYRNGDFSAISPNGGSRFNRLLGIPSSAIATDAMGRSIFANTIYDPMTRGTSGGNGFADPFPGNVIPRSRFSPVAVAIQELIPLPSNDKLTNNYAGFNLGHRVSKIPSVKLDQSLGSASKLSFYWSTTGTDSPYNLPNGMADGLTELLSQARGTFIHSVTERLNYDRVLSPTLLVHLGAGYSRILFLDDSPYTHNGGAFDCAAIHIQGCFVAYNFPRINPMLGGANSTGGMQAMGNAANHQHTTTLRTAFNANVSWTRASHTYKAGGELWVQGNITAPPSGIVLTPGLATTAEPFTAGLSASSAQQMGFPYASFLLGGVDSVNQIALTDLRMGKTQAAWFVQDSWKATRKLTLDYGLRWDFATAAQEQYGRSASLGLVPNPTAGGRLGAPIFEATCHCNFVSNYPWAYAPRLGVAYQLSPKTVLRGGWGIVYSFAPDFLASSGANQLKSGAGVNGFVSLDSADALPRPVFPNFDPGQTPLPNQIVGFTGFTSLDRHASRPPRQNQWSIGIQREITRDFVLEASYVANRGVWWLGTLSYLNQVSPQAFAALGLNPYANPADNVLLGSQLSSAGVIARVGNIRPYSGYLTSNTLLNALRPFPQFSNITVTNSPTGNTWYDSLQMKGTKRMGRGLQVNSTFTWSKALISQREDLFNPSSGEKSIQFTDQPFLLTAAALYETQKFFRQPSLRFITGGWQLGAFVQYGSGLPLPPPTASNTNNLGTSEMFRTGQPLFLKNLNCGCINPYTDQVLNPAAWVNPATGMFGPGPSVVLPSGFSTTYQGLYYTDFRQARRPVENFNIGRRFRFNDRMSLQIRAEFSNIFNRTQIGNPGTLGSGNNPVNAPPKNGGGQFIGGFGVYNLTVAAGTTPTIGSQLYAQPRQGTLIARFLF